MARYEVIVGNIGKVYDGDSLPEAQLHVVAYIDQSKSERGRAGGESVTLMKDGDILTEFIGTQDKS
jgi:hypothetical protein